MACIVGKRPVWSVLCCLLVEVKPGSRQDTEWLALSANQKYGLRWSHKDKQRIARNALLHPYGATLSNQEITRHCGVDHKTVGKMRQELELWGISPDEVTNLFMTREVRQIALRMVRESRAFGINFIDLGQS